MFELKKAATVSLPNKSTVNGRDSKLLNRTNKTSPVITANIKRTVAIINVKMLIQL